MKTIKLNQCKHSNPMSVIVDDEDFDFLNQWKWFAHKRRTKYYASRTVWISDDQGMKKSHTISMHRVIMGVSDANVLVDHRNMDSLNNQKSNLRTCNISQNNANIKSRKNSTSKYLGVHRIKNTTKWIAQVRKNNVSHSLGRFETEELAAIAYNKKAVELHGEFANINVIK